MFLDFFHYSFIQITGNISKVIFILYNSFIRYDSLDYHTIGQY